MTAIEQALAKLAAPPHGANLGIDRAACDAALFGLPVGVTAAEMRVRIRAALAAAEPLIVADVTRRVLSGSTVTVEWAMRVHYADGQPPTSGSPTSREVAEMSVEGLSDELNKSFRAARRIDRAEVVCREVRALRDGSTLVGPWHAPDEGEG